MSAHPENLQMQQYLGDGAYVGHDGHHVVLYPSDGVQHAYPVYLDPDTLNSFLLWVDDNLKTKVRA